MDVSLFILKPEKEQVDTLVTALYIALPLISASVRTDHKFKERQQGLDEGNSATGLL